MAKIGRNDPCSCGSGKKFKRCCEARAATRRGRLLALAVAGAIAAAIIAGVASSRDRGAGPKRVWSAEHGHYHDVP